MTMRSDISYKDLSGLLDNIKTGKVAPVYLLYGNEFLLEAAFKRLLNALVPVAEQALNYEALDGAVVNIYDLVERLNTFPIFAGRKAIAVHGTNIFSSEANVDDLLGKAEEAFEKEDLMGSAVYFLQVLSMARLPLNDAGDGDIASLLRNTFDIGEKHLGPWLNEVADYCLRENMTAPTYQDDADVLTEAIEAGFPETNHLILTTDFVDKRRKLYRTIKAKGVVIDCSVGEGGKTAGRRQQKEVLKAQMREALKTAGKTIAPGGFEVLYEKTGSGLRNFNNELEKLITFVGDQKRIELEDIEQALDMTKEDPIYEVSNAIGERATQKALFLIGRLLKANFYPLQILATIINQVRKLILARDFIRCSQGIGWKRGLSYGAFQKIILPELQKHETELFPGNAHPFVIYKTLQQADNYTFEELAKAMKILLDADIRLKTTRHDARIVLDHAILEICGTSKLSRN
ncbi:MAG: hypothetical protein DRH43_01065 [Deltaproteobacteria bacterium]|nr:MAG: hypothetical protein DRH43_01065 [Deltaproteobacteria bacterium]